MHNDDSATLGKHIGIDSPLDRLNWAEDSADSVRPDPEEMLSLLDSSDHQQRMLAARAFCELEDERAVPKLILLIQDACPLIRVSATYALGRNPSATAIDALTQQLQTEWNGYVRKGIVWALGNCRDRRTMEPLIDALKTDISAVRLWAASALAQMAHVGYDAVITVIPALIEGLRRDPVSAVRSNCAWSLGRLCRELPSNVVYATAVDALIEAFAEDEDMGVREDARIAVLRVGDPRGLQVIEAIEQEGLV
jgi:HEAT repeat protein